MKLFSTCPDNFYVQQAMLHMLSQQDILLCSADYATLFNRRCYNVQYAMLCVQQAMLLYRMQIDPTHLSCVVEEAEFVNKIPRFRSFECSPK